MSILRSVGKLALLAMLAVAAHGSAAPAQRCTFSRGPCVRNTDCCHRICVYCIGCTHGQCL